MRRRLGVALLIPEPASSDINALRRALGDTQLDRIPTHLTLVPPINVRESDLPAVLDLIRGAGAATRPFHLALGPVTTFLPDAPVAYLGVSGDLEAVHALRELVFVPPIERDLTWPYVPHVTVLDEGEPERINAAIAALQDFRAEIAIQDVTLLEQQGRVWRPLADAAFGAPAIVGRGSLDLQIHGSFEPDPHAMAFLERNWLAHDAAMFHGSTRWERNDFTLTARRNSQVIGVAIGWTALGVGYLGELLVDPTCRGEGVGSHLLAALEQLARERGCLRLALRTDRDSAAQRFYEARGWTLDATISDWLGGHDFVELRRDVPE